jgi:hypothetical protein
MRYFFDVVKGGETLADTSGTELSGPDVATLHAAVVAVDMAQDASLGADCLIRVRDERGALVLTLPVTQET